MQLALQTARPAHGIRPLSNWNVPCVSTPTSKQTTEHATVRIYPILPIVGILQLVRISQCFCTNSCKCICDQKLQFLRNDFTVILKRCIYVINSLYRLTCNNITVITITVINGRIQKLVNRLGGLRWCWCVIMVTEVTTVLTPFRKWQLNSLCKYFCF